MSSFSVGQRHMKAKTSFLRLVELAENYTEQRVENEVPILGQTYKYEQWKQKLDDDTAMWFFQKQLIKSFYNL